MLENRCGPADRNSPIGVFDSGVGGLSVLKAIWEEVPSEAVIYLADQAHVPYGQKPLEEVRRYSEDIVHFLLKEGVKLVVIACNTASAAALHWLRLRFPSIPFVGMEPAIKPAAENSRSRVVGVLATPATFQGQLYSSLVERFAQDVHILQNTCPGLVNQVESGELGSALTRRILEEAIQPMLLEGIDSLVLGCTHYPFVMKLIREIAGQDVRVINPAPAVARQVRRVLESRDCMANRPTGTPRAGRTVFYTTGQVEKIQALLPFLLEIDEHPPVNFVELAGLDQA
jgi:glutamate racemase